MADVLNIVLSGFWPWLGTMLLLAMIGVLIGTAGKLALDMVNLAWRIRADRKIR